MRRIIATFAFYHEYGRPIAFLMVREDHESISEPAARTIHATHRPTHATRQY